MIYRAVFHVDLDEVKPFAIALSNISNLLRAIPEKHYDLVLLCNGPAVVLLQSDACAPHREEIWQLQQARVSFKVCRNALNRFNIDPDNLIEGCEIVPAGIVTLIELQQDGYAYIKP
ncbi:DsrE family protein [Desulfobulbus oligotrophicus]|jgi:intracellular sulfur oxidation DsrE/DsrF family protein|uniref:DsrE family protein n=1 Tax=Desulfobulbus oligotrophicus TaxID=1909699 RepID=A0A7T6ARD2_9BACT|nr:DsrE family protein [Desulfobulbus oligotrophicus]MDY0391743.1 DsrE family protein [Desulfobulbus oligotrophicus]QQG66410.1 DsrE family protein [Desulfobulbus oligotrophicus]